jgi:hypothetical protein
MKEPIYEFKTTSAKQRHMRQEVTPEGMKKREKKSFLVQRYFHIPSVSHGVSVTNPPIVAIEESKERKRQTKSQNYLFLPCG